MPWQDQLREASFRGVKFRVENSETDGGQRQVVHKYPKRNKVYVEEMGLQPDTFTVRAYLIGSEFISERDALIKEMKTPGPGTLVLPTQGSRKVTPQTYRQGYDRQQGGIEYLDLIFIEPGENTYPAGTIDTGTQVQAAADKAVETIKGVFQANFTVQGFQDFVGNSAQQMNQNLVTAISNAGNVRAKIPEQAAIFNDSLLEFEQNIPSLILSPSTLVNTILNQIGQISAIFDLPMAAYAAYAQLFKFGANALPLPKKTRSQQQQALNQDMTFSLVRRASLIGMARTATGIDFDSYDDAVTLRDSLASQIDDEILKIGDTDLDDIYLDLNGVMATMVADVTARAANLERIRTVTYSQTLPSLVVSYDVYETPERADEIVRRNKVNHPGFIPAGQPIQILI